ISGIIPTGNNATDYDFGELKPSSVGGFVYVDANDNGIKDTAEVGISGATVTLTGFSDLGSATNITTTSAVDGSYTFSNLRPGTYTVTETQPAGYLDGKDSLGSAGGTAANDVFTGIHPLSGTTGTGYDFGEL